MNDLRIMGYLSVLHEVAVVSLEQLGKCCILHLIFIELTGLYCEIVTMWPVIPCQGQKFNFQTSQVTHFKGKHARFFMYRA